MITDNKTTLKDYDPFGMITVGRNWTSGSGEEYRFGFNGKENTDEIYGDDNAVDFGARIYDCRIGRWLSVDKKYFVSPSSSCYAYVSNNPISRFDPDGNTDYDIVYKVIRNDKNQITEVVADIKIIYQVIDLSSQSVPVDDQYDIVGEGKYQAQFVEELRANGEPYDVRVTLNISIEYEFIKTYEQINEDKNLLVVVDDVKETNSNTLGVAIQGGQATIIEYSQRNSLTTILHELGHNLGFNYPDSETDAAHSDDPDHLMYKSPSSTKTNGKDFRNVFVFLALKISNGSGHVNSDRSDNVKTQIKYLLNQAKYDKSKAKEKGF